MRFLSSPWLTFARICNCAFAVVAVSWASVSIPTFRIEAEFANAARHILMGERFNSAQLGVLQRDIDAATVSSLRSLALADVAVVRLRLLENELASGNTQPSQSEELRTAVGMALAGAPSSSFLWLMEYWLDGARTGTPNRALPFLRLSYWLGPNEGWIAIRRNPLAVQVFPALPEECQQQVLIEFKGLVRSGYYLDAASILAGPGWPIRGKLLNDLAGLSLADRAEFAKVLKSKDLEDVAVPGLEKQPFRPF